MYGLGARADSEKAIRAIFEAKGRPTDNPLIVHVSSVDMASRYADIGVVEEALFGAFAPGPLTLVCPVRPQSLCSLVTAGGTTVAIRIPENDTALQLISQVDCGLAAPSANRSGRPSPTDATHARFEMNGRVAAVLDGGACRVGIESTVARWNGRSVEVLRPGAITEEALNNVAREVVGGRTASDSAHTILSESACPERSVSEAPPQSPGTKYRHYAPNIPVRLFEHAYELLEADSDATSFRKNAIICHHETAKTLPSWAGRPRESADRFEIDLDNVETGRDAPLTAADSVKGHGPLVLTFTSYEQLSANLYRSLWRLEKLVAQVWIELPPDRNEYAGLRDRLFRAGDRRETTGD